jgi:hypothetical protein
MSAGEESYEVCPFLKICEHPAAATYARLARRNVQPHLVQTVRRHGGPEFGRHVRWGGGWGIPIAPPTLMITVGGIATKPRYLDGILEPRELDITVSVDHGIVDGAAAARFTRRLAELLEHPIELTILCPKVMLDVVRSAPAEEI